MRVAHQFPKPAEMHAGGCPLDTSRSEAVRESNPADVSLDQHPQDAAHLFIFFSVHHPPDLAEPDVVLEVYVEREEPFVEVLARAGKGTCGYHLGDDRIVVAHLDDVLQENSEQVGPDVPTIFLDWLAWRRLALAFLPPLLPALGRVSLDGRLDDDAGLVSRLKAGRLALLQGMAGKGVEMRITPRFRLGELVIKREGAVVENSWV